MSAATTNSTAAGKGSVIPLPPSDEVTADLECPHEFVPSVSMHSGEKMVPRALAGERGASYTIFEKKLEMCRLSYGKCSDEITVWSLSSAQVKDYIRPAVFKRNERNRMERSI
mmetsp:Transcript_8539/g.13102  ORF Transcript_8539/g.13102 Transcript_8539/m.13102 type:complete len:113 (-) Transcript_8539:1397-1735(-)